MTNQDREQFQALLQRQALLEEALQQLRIELKAWERQAELIESPSETIAAVPSAPMETAIPLHAEPPPLPVLPTLDESSVCEVAVQTPLPEPVAPPAPAVTHEPPPFIISRAIEPVPVDESVPVAEPVPPAESPAPSLPLPSFPPVPAETEHAARKENKQVALEFQFGRWLARIGVVFLLITLITASVMAYKNFHGYMGPWSKLTALTVISVGLVAVGLRFERKDSKLLVYGRTLAGGGLACLYYTLYGATYVEPLKVIDSTFLGGLLLLAWSGYVLYLAESKKSELLSIFAIALAYFSSAITPVGGFTMVANLMLSLTAVIFLVRNAWTGLSYLCLIGTYVGLLRQLVVENKWSFTGFDVVQGLPFWPSATYLAGAWIIYTAGVFLANSPHFAAGKRMAFLCLNNGALIGLLTLVAFLSGFGHVGGILCVVGGTFLLSSRLARQFRADAGEVANAYLMQGLALATGGLVIAYSGVTRGLLITVESVFLAAATAYSRSLIMRAGAALSALLGTAFLLVETYSGAAHPWVLILSGTVAMLANAWLARRDLWPETRETAQRFVPASAYYSVLAIALLGLGIDSLLSAAWSAPVMALTALALTFSVYLVPLFELPLVVFLLLAFALRVATFPFDDSHPWWSELLTGLATMALAAWWPRQKIIRTEPWLQPMLLVFALAMAAVSFCAVHPHVDAQGWMISASLLSLGFLLFGLYARAWSFALSGQILLGAAIYSFLSPTEGYFPWSWWAAAAPIAATFLTAWLVQSWLKQQKNDSDAMGLLDLLKVSVCVYQAMTLLLVARLIFGLVPDTDVPLCFYAVGTALLVWNLKWPGAMGIRCGLTLDIFGTYDYLAQVHTETTLSSTWPNALGLLILLAQPGLLRRWGTALISAAEISGVKFLASFTVSLYVYFGIHPHVDAQGWMIAASLLSLLFMVYGAWTRTWQFMVSGQIYLGLAIWAFFTPPGDVDSFPWAWWAAAFPPVMVLLTAYLAPKLVRYSGLPAMVQENVDAAAYLYHVLALVLTARWIFGIVPAPEETLAFFALATALLVWNLYRPNAFGARAGLAMSVLGSYAYLVLHSQSENTGFTVADTLAFALFLAQPALLRHWGHHLLTEVEGWCVVLLSSGMAWLFVSNSITVTETHNLTLAWALVALVLILIGFAVNERRQRWCGLIVLVGAILRVGIYDFWYFSDLYKVLTFFALTVICLGLSFLYYKFADRLKEWL